MPQPASRNFHSFSERTPLVAIMFIKKLRLVERVPFLKIKYVMVKNNSIRKLLPGTVIQDAASKETSVVIARITGYLVVG